jgi:SAM-dependent methyltransferase
VSRKVEKFQDEFRHDLKLELNPSLTEPFGTVRNASRLMFDFGAMTSLLNYELLQLPLLDFGAGTGWLSELFVRMSIPTVSFDIHNDLEGCIQNRVDADIRLDVNLWKYQQGDGHSMPFKSNSFGNLCCYDSLHHMHDYSLVFTEIYRVLAPGGRAIFIEPGARHSHSPETISFLKAQKQLDSSWIERDVILEEIDQVARLAGFHNGVQIAPIPHPNVLQEFSLESWQGFRSGDQVARLRFTDQLAQINYDERVLFYVAKV